MNLLETPNAGAYQVIYADPPWRFRVRSETSAGIKKSPSAHYRTPHLDEVKALPVADVAARDAWLFMWTTWPHLMDGSAFALAQAWSDPANPWTGRTGGTWAKRPRGWRGDPNAWQMGTGYIFRSASELLLVFGRGRVPWTAKGERNLWIAPVRAHSQKPEEVRDMLRRSTTGPRLEMFANDDAEGFDRWGDGHEVLPSRPRKPRVKPVLP